MTKKPIYIFHNDNPDKLLSALQVQLLHALKTRKIFICSNEAENREISAEFTRPSLAIQKKT
jgi:hypothetical protein